jgi:hypothetical protein
MISQYLELIKDYVGFEPIPFIVALFIVLIYFKMKS